MFMKHLLAGLALIGSIVALQDCCYLDPEHTEGGLVRS